MSTNDSRSDDDRADDGHESDGETTADDEERRYDDLEVANGDVVIYDTENHCAWIQSDNAVEGESLA